LVDMRAFIGEPGAEHRETIASASAAAAAGGVTTLVTRPDTNPPVDDPAVVDFILRRARDDAKVRVHPAAALTKGLIGEEIAEIGLLAEAGAIAFCDGPHSVADARTMRRAMTYARDFDTLIALDVGDYRTFLKLSPPLRAEDERMALVEALSAGLIDVVCSDHDPQDV